MALSSTYSHNIISRTCAIATGLLLVVLCGCRDVMPSLPTSVDSTASGGRIFFSTLSNSRITSILPNGTDPRTLTGSKYVMVCAPQHGKIVHVYDRTSIVLMNTDGSNPVPIATTDTSRKIYAVLAPDGATVVYQHEIPGQPSYRTQWTVVNTDNTGTPRNVFIFPQLGSIPVYAPDGQSIAFYGLDYDQFTLRYKYTSIYVYDVRTSQTKQIVNDIGNTLYSPSSELRFLDWSVQGKIVFVGEDFSMGTAISTVNQNGTSRRVIANAGECSHASFSSDGNSIVFTERSGGSMKDEVKIMNADGTGERTVLEVQNGDDVECPRFSPNNQKILASVGDRLCVFDIGPSEIHYKDSLRISQTSVRSEGGFWER